MSKKNISYNKLVNKTSYNLYGKTDRLLFDTSRFSDVTSSRQSRNGTVMYRDNQNPGVFYTSHSSGYVRRIIKTVVKQENSQGVSTYNQSRAYQINPRGNNNSTLMINKGNYSI